MDMVEKTRRSLTVLRRCQEADREELNHWIRRYSNAEDVKKGPAPVRPLGGSAGPEGPQLGVHWGGGGAGGAVQGPGGVLVAEVLGEGTNTHRALSRRSTIEFKSKENSSPCTRHHLTSWEPGPQVYSRPP